MNQHQPCPHCRSTNTVACRTRDVDGVWLWAHRCPGCRTWWSSRVVCQPQDPTRAYNTPTRMHGRGSAV